MSRLGSTAGGSEEEDWLGKSASRRRPGRRSQCWVETGKKAWSAARKGEARRGRCQDRVQLRVSKRAEVPEDEHGDTGAMLITCCLSYRYGGAGYQASWGAALDAKQVSTDSREA